ncbi:hypothetical protein ACFL5Z_18395 [Planctomycetota bacterium]
MIEKMVEMFTPEMIAIAILALTVLTLFTSFMVLVTIVSVSRVKKHLLVIVEKSLELEEKHAVLQQARQMMSNNVARFTEDEDKIQSMERRLDEFDHTIAESQDQLTGYASKLNEHDTLLGQAGQMMGEEAAGFKQAVQRIQVLEEKFQGLKVFQRTFEQTRNRILNVLGGVPVEMPSQNSLTAEQKDSKEEAVIPSEEERPDTEDFQQSRMRYQ